MNETFLVVLTLMASMFVIGVYAGRNSCGDDDWKITHTETAKLESCMLMLDERINVMEKNYASLVTRFNRVSSNLYEKIDEIEKKIG